MVDAVPTNLKSLDHAYDQFCRSVVSDAERIARILAPTRFDDFRQVARHFCDEQVPQSPYEYEQRLQEWRRVAAVLRRKAAASYVPHYSF